MSAKPSIPGKAAERKQIETASERLWKAIDIWMQQLDRCPGWKEWQRKRFSKTLNFGDPLLDYDRDEISDFKFPEDIEAQHEIVMGFLRLQDTLAALMDCEYYFRRYPFRGMPMTRSRHITNICEMYFNKFYEFEERLKKHLNAILKQYTQKKIDMGRLIKLYETEFGQEIRARNAVHHHSRFEDIAIDRVFVMSVLSTKHKYLESEHVAAYRKVVCEWAERVKVRSRVLEKYLEAVAEITLAACPFLSDTLDQEVPNSIAYEPLPDR